MRGKKKIAIITGATSGFGKIFAEFTDTQFRGIDEFWLVGRNQERMEQVCRRMNHRTRPFLYDLSRMEDLIKLKSVLEKENPSIKILVNAAGFGVTGHVSDQDENVLAEMVDVNCRALTWISRICIPYMADNSRIINFASVAAFMPQPSFAVYAATKAYVMCFTRALNCELRKKNIYALAVCPGPADTGFFATAERIGGKQAGAYKELFMAKPEQVVKKAIHDSVMKREVSVYSIPMQALRVITKIIPRKLIFGFLR